MFELKKAEYVTRHSRCGASVSLSHGKVMLGKGHFNPGCCPCGLSLCADDKGDVWTQLPHADGGEVSVKDLSDLFHRYIVTALSSTRLISGSTQPLPDAHCSFISHLCPLFTQQAVAPRPHGAAIIAGG